MREDRVIPMRRLDWLSPRERAVLIHMMDGLSAEEMAPLDFVTVATVRSQIRNVLMKLGVSSQLAAVAHAYAACWPTEEERRQAMMAAMAQVEVMA